MNIIRKILVVVSTFLLCIAFGLMCYFALDNSVKADSNSDKIAQVNLVGSDDFSSNSMPDYNRFILNSNSFYDNNSVRNITYDYVFSLESYKLDDYPETFVLLDYYEYFFSNSSQAQNAYNYLSQIPSANGFIICGLGYHNRVYIGTNYFKVVTIEDSKVFLRVCCRVENVRFFVSDIDTSSFNLSYSFNESNNRYCFVVSGLPLESTEPNVYINYGDLNRPLWTNSSGDIDYNDCWGYSSFREDYISINYDVFSYYYFKYGLISRPYTNCWWCGGVRLTFNSSNINDIVLVPSFNHNGFQYGWHADTGLIINKIDFQPSGNWQSYVYNSIPNEYESEMAFYYYVDGYLTNSFNSDNSYYDSTYLYRQDVQWYDIFGHLYNFLIYLLFDMPLISSITKPIYILISGTTTTFNWLAGCVAGLGIFGAFAMCYLLFAIIKRFL